MIVDWTISFGAGLREHLLRVEFDFELGISGRLSTGPSSRSTAEYDCGEAGSAVLRRAWLVRGIKGKDGHARERLLWPAALERLKRDKRFGELLYESAVQGMPSD